MSPAGQLLLPALVLLPLLALLPAAWHGGGLDLIGQFLLAAVQPSTDPALIAASLRGIAITVAVALWSWLFSLLLGVIGGVLSAEVVSRTLWGCGWPALLLRRLLAIPRSLHELLWGLILLQLLGLHPAVAVLAIALPYGALFARVVAEQLDGLPRRNLEALQLAGAPAPAALLMALSPPLWPQLLSYGGYRLECALRSATLLGVFGLGGIGADLRLALQSLQFHEVWTSLWLLAAVMLALELVLARLRQRWLEPNRELLVGFAALLLLLLPASQWLELRWQVLFSPWQWPEVLPLWDPSGWLQDWPQLIGSTLLLTALAALLAVALLPLLLLLLGPGRWPRLLLSACGLLARLLPPPLTALLLLFVLQPGLLPAVLALGLHNAGILGRLGLECWRLAGQRRRCDARHVAGGWLQRHRPQLFELRGLPRRCDPARERGGGPGGRWRFGGGAAGVVEFVCLGRGAVLVVYAGLTLVGEQLADLYRRRLLSGPLPREGCQG